MCSSGASNLEELQKILTEKLMIRRLKKDVLTQLPPKQRQRIPFEVKDSALKKVFCLVHVDINLWPLHCCKLYCIAHGFIYLFIEALLLFEL